MNDPIPTKLITKLTLAVFSFALSAGGFIYLFMWNWHVALAIGLIIWGNNIALLMKD